MSEIKVIKNKNYSVISNYHLQDKELSLKAKGLMCLMLSLPDDWDFSIKGLATLSKDGKESVMNVLKELEENNYLIRNQRVNEKGQFNGYEYLLYEKPQTEKPCSENPNTENPTQINGINNNINTLINKQNTKEYIYYGTYKRIKLKTTDYEKLINEYGKNYIDDVIQKLDEYVESNNNKNKYTNYNLVIRKAIREKWFNIQKEKSSGSEWWDNLKKGLSD